MRRKVLHEQDAPSYYLASYSAASTQWQEFLQLLLPCMIYKTLEVQAAYYDTELIWTMMTTDAHFLYEIGCVGWVVEMIIGYGNDATIRLYIYDEVDTFNSHPRGY